MDLARLLPLVLSTACGGTPATTTSDPQPAPAPSAPSAADSPTPEAMTPPPTTPDPHAQTATLKVGDAAPPLDLPTTDGGRFVLGEALAKGPVIAVFYRGDW